jgi:serine/threonine-protein kinase
VTSTTPQIGSILAGKFRVERVLGQGGMGVVLAATQLPIDEPVALKLMHHTLASDHDLVTRFQREAKAARKIKSEHVVRILDVGALENGTPFLVMEYLEGRDLDGLLRANGPMPVAVAIDHLLQAMEALAEAHVQGMVHRDLKPANLFVTRRADGTSLVKVLDFGISKVVGNDGGSLGLTKTNAASLGSPLYMSPEQMRSVRDVDARTDIWALGVILYELVTGKAPFQGETMTELCARIIQDPPPSVRTRRPDVPAALEHVIWRCLAKDPSGRYIDVGALASDLALFASPAGKASLERITGVFRLTGPTAPMMPPLTPRTPSAAPPRGGTTASSWGETRAPLQPEAKPSMAVPIAIVLGFVFVGAIGSLTYAFFGPSVRLENVKIIQTGNSGEKGKDDTSPVPASENTSKPFAPPVFIEPASGTYGGALDVVLSTYVKGAAIHYTIDGSTPSVTSPVYTKPVHIEPAVNGAVKIEAISVAPGYSQGLPRFSLYMFHPSPVVTPAFVSFGDVPCGTPAEQKAFKVDNHSGKPLTFDVSMSENAKSPFFAHSEGRLPPNGSTSVMLTLREIKLDPDSLIGIDDTVQLKMADGTTRMVTASVHPQGVVLDFDNESSLDLGDGKRPANVRVRNLGTIDATVVVDASGNFSTNPKSVHLRAGEAQPVTVTWKPPSAMKETAKLVANVAPGTALCGLPAAIPLKGDSENP